MALTGHLSDLSLSELIEFFCNQRKTGKLTVLYPKGPGSFYLQAGSVVDARIGVLRGIDAVYFALTLPNAKFEFSGSDEAAERTINQPWTQVVLEGLRRLDEGIVPTEAYPDDFVSDEPNRAVAIDDVSAEPGPSPAPAFMSFMHNETLTQRKPFILAAIAIAILGSVAVVGVPAGWYKRAKPAVVATQPAAAPEAQTTMPNPETTTAAPVAEADSRESEAAALAAKRQRERDKAKARDERNEGAGATSSATASALPPPVVTPDPVKAAGPKKVTVTVTYDESGRVTQASGGDPTAIRIARQKRFPAGKAGSATVTIPIN